MWGTVKRSDQVVSRTAAGPGWADAERAAAALVDAGVARVVLFGSVARGDATERSDIDLMAIYDDLDYSQRWEKELELVAAAKAATGYPVDVVVTDRPEWKVRVEGVRASLENRAARYGVVLVDRPPGVVDWDKEMVMPVDDYQEALYRLSLVDNSLLALRERLEPGSVERLEQQMGNEVRAFDVYSGTSGLGVRSCPRSGGGLGERVDPSRWVAGGGGVGARHRQTLRADDRTSPQHHAAPAGTLRRRGHHRLACACPLPQGRARP